MSVTLLQVTNQLSLCGLVEFVFHLSRLDPDMLQIISDSGQLTQSFFTFQINQQGQYHSVSTAKGTLMFSATVGPIVFNT